MYIALTWRPLRGADARQVGRQIVIIVRTLETPKKIRRFVNVYRVLPGHLLANVRHHRYNRGEDAFKELRAELRRSAPGNFAFCLYYLPSGFVIGHSSGISRDRLSEIEDY